MRKFSWFILAVNALFLIWVISALVGGGSAIEACEGITGNALTTCEAENAGTAVGTGIGVILIIVLWAFVDVILGFIWLVTNRKKERTT